MIFTFDLFMVWFRRTASGGMADHRPAGTAPHQRGAARSSWGNYPETCLKMNWFHCVRRWENQHEGSWAIPQTIVTTLQHLVPTASQAVLKFFNSPLHFSSLVRSTRWGWWWTSMETTEVTPSSPSATSRRPEQLWSSWTTMRSGQGLVLF